VRKFEEKLLRQLKVETEMELPRLTLTEPRFPPPFSLYLCIAWRKSYVLTNELNDNTRACECLN